MSLRVGDLVWVRQKGTMFEGQIEAFDYAGRGANITGYRVAYTAEATGFLGETLKQPATGTFKRAQLEKRHA